MTFIYSFADFQNHNHDIYTCSKNVDYKADADCCCVVMPIRATHNSSVIHSIIWYGWKATVCYVVKRRNALNLG